MTGHAVKVGAGMNPCRPSFPRNECANCARFDLQGLPDDPESRPGTVVVDPSAVVRDAPCGLLVPILGSGVAAPKPARYRPPTVKTAKPVKPTKPTNGLKTLDDLRERCDVEGKHWYWTGNIVRRRPASWVMGERVCGQLITAKVLGRAAQRQPHQRWVATCGDPLCLSPRCLRLATHVEAHAIAGKAGRLARTTATRLKNMLAAQSRSTSYPAWMVEWARESPQSAPEIARALGVGRSTVVSWRSGSRRAVQEVTPFSQLFLKAAA